MRLWKCPECGTVQRYVEPPDLCFNCGDLVVWVLVKGNSDAG